MLFEILGGGQVSLSLLQMTFTEVFTTCLV